MYRELQPLRQALSTELKASLFPAVAGVDPNKLLETYLDRLTMYIGVDVADQTLTLIALDAGRETLGISRWMCQRPRWLSALRDLGSGLA